MKSTSRWPAVLAMVCVLALLVAACGDGNGEQAAAPEDSDPAGAEEGEADGGEADSGDPFQISFSLFTEEAPLFRVIRTNLEDVLEGGDYGVEVKWYDNEGDPGVMLQNAQLMVSDQPDGIVFYPVSTATDGISQIFEDSGIPCVAVNLDVAYCSFLNIDNAALGVDTATIIGELAAEQGWDASNTTVLLGQNAAAGEQVNDCVRYFYSTIAPILGMEEIDPTTITPSTTTIGDNAIQFDGASQLEPSYEAVSGLLPSVPDDHNIILYTVNNDSTTGALRALEEAGRADEGSLLIGGLGGDDTGITALREDPRWVAEGDIFVAWWGQYAVAMAQALAQGHEPPEDVTALPQIVLSEETVDEYHDPETGEVTSLPPLEESNDYLREGGFLQQVGNIEGL